MPFPLLNDLPVAFMSSLFITMSGNSVRGPDSSLVVISLGTVSLELFLPPYFPPG